MENQETLAPGRLINLDTNIYNPHTKTIIYPGREGCDHDFPENPTSEEDTSASWECTRCPLEILFEVWD